MDIIIRQDKYGKWHCQFGAEEYPHFDDLIGFEGHRILVSQPFTCLSCGELEGRFVPQSNRSLISQQEDAEVRHNEDQRPGSPDDDDSNSAIGRLGQKQFDATTKRLIDNIDHEQDKEEPNETLIAKWKRQLNELQTHHGKLVNRKGRPRQIVAGDPYWQQIKRVERNLASCRKAIAKNMPMLAEHLRKYVHRQGEYFSYTPPRTDDSDNST